MNALRLAQIYNDSFMDEDLFQAHQENDKEVLRAYGLKPKASEEEIVELLMNLYTRRVADVKKEKATNEAIRKIIGKNVTEIPAWLEKMKDDCLAEEYSVEEMILQGKAKKKELLAAERRAKKKNTD